ncbi:MAG: response regulator [Anaerolineaceae bacterium]|nr:response regulator [Anaerolineaceae bacterium]
MDNNTFYNAVKEALNHLSDPAYLKNHQLVQYFLTETESRQSNWIQLLHAKVSEIIDLLRPPEGTPETASEWRSSKILSLRYLRGFELYRIEEELGLSQRQTHRELKKAVDAFVTISEDMHLSRKVQEQSGEIPDASDLENIKTELKSWEITFDLYNLRQMIEEVLQLCESMDKTDLRDLIQMDDVPSTLNINVDQILTKQGLYKILGMVDRDVANTSIRMSSRKINEQFIELSIHISHQQSLMIENWQIAQVFFTIQNIKNQLIQQDNETTISIVLPLKHQSSCLVIDDVSSVRRLIERMLGSYGIQVFGTDDPQAAQALAIEIQPDFILLDILMPKLDGWQLIKNLKAHPETGHIPVIICSVLYEPDLAKAVGATAYVRKPINRLSLIQTLQQVALIPAEIE